MDSRARVEQAVFDFLRPQLKAYREQSTELARAAANSIGKVVQHAEAVVSTRRRELKRAQDALEACQAQEDADCSGYVRQVQAAQQALQRAVQGRDVVNEASTRFRHSQSRHNVAVDQLLLRGEKLVRTADERTTGYQKSSSYSPSVTLLSASRLGGGSGPSLRTSGGSTGPSVTNRAGGGDHGDTGDLAPTITSWKDLPGVAVPPGFPDQFASIPISLIINDNPIMGPEDFDAGQNLTALNWSSEALLDVVLPAMAKVPDVKAYLLDRDRRDGLVGDRSYTATHSGFFSPSSAIRLRPQADGSFELINGRHRLWLMSRAGADSVPALIAGAAR